MAVPVEIFPATHSAAKISFRQIHQPSGKPIRYQKVVPGIGPVDADEIIRGYEYDKDRYLLLDDDEIDDLNLETKRTLELLQFVEETEIPPIYYERPYFVVPQDELAKDAFRVVRDALRQTRRVGLGQLTMRGKESLVALRQCGPGMLLETLRCTEELRRAEQFFGQISEDPADPDLLAVATQLIERKTAAFDAGTFQDHYETALKSLIDAKLKAKGGKIEVAEDEPRRPAGDNVIDLMAALKRSLEDAGGKAAAGASGTGARTRSATASTPPADSAKGKGKGRARADQTAGAAAPRDAHDDADADADGKAAAKGGRRKPTRASA